MFHGFSTINRWSLVCCGCSFGTETHSQTHDKAKKKKKKTFHYTVTDLYFLVVHSPWGVILGTSYQRTGSRPRVTFLQEVLLLSSI